MARLQREGAALGKRLRVPRLRCAAEGLHNGGVTAFGGCTFVDNRQDVASDDGTLTDSGGNSYDTGGPTSPPIG